MIYFQYFTTPYGDMILAEHDNSIVICDWRYRKMRKALDQKISTFLGCDYTEKSTPLLQELQQQLNAYFNKEIHNFDIPYTTVGTAFQKQTWETLQQIPYGSTWSYLELAEKMGNPKAVRAVASANGANCLALLIPCHRVVGNDGDLVGYAGGLQAKKKLLDLEKNLTTLTLFDL